MDELIKQGQWWWPFLVPAATGLLALLGSRYGSTLGKTTEHEQWLRNQKKEAYADFLTKAQELSTGIMHTYSMEPDERVFPDIHSLKVLQARIDVVGSDEVRKVGMAIHAAMWSAFAAHTFMIGATKETFEKFWKQFCHYDREVSRLIAMFVVEVRKDLGTYSKADEGFEDFKPDETLVRKPAEVPAPTL